MDKLKLCHVLKMEASNGKRATELAIFKRRCHEHFNKFKRAKTVLAMPVLGSAVA